MSGDEADGDPILVLNVEDILPLFTSRTLQYIRIQNFILTHRGSEHPRSALPSNVVVDLIIGALNNYGGPLKRLHLPDEISPTPAFDSLSQFAEHAPWLESLSITLCVPPGWSHQVESRRDVPFKTSLQGLFILNDSTSFQPEDLPRLAK